MVATVTNLIEVRERERALKICAVIDDFYSVMNFGQRRWREAKVGRYLSFLRRKIWFS